MQSLNIKEWILLELQITQTRHPLSIVDGKMSKFNTPQNEKKIMKRAQNRRCTSSICEQSLGKVWIKKNENFWSYRLHKLGTLKCFGRTDTRTDGQTDDRSGPTTRPAFAKATQVTKRYIRTDGSTDNVKTVYPPQTKFAC